MPKEFLRHSQLRISMFRRLTLSLSTAVFLIVPTLAQAQLGDPSAILNLAGIDPITVTLTPDLPGPLSNVTAEVTSTVFDPNRASITWALDGRLVPEAKEKMFGFTMGKMGSRRVLEVTARTPEGQTYTKRLEVRPAVVDLIWEARSSYVPAFYKGKALAGPGSPLTLTAIPDLRTSVGTRIPASELTYTWEQNGRVVNGVSGRGKNSITLPGPEVFADFEIVLTVTSLDGSAGARTFLTVPATLSRLMLYESHPTLGIRLERSLRTEFISSGELEASAQPYFVDTPNAGSTGARYTWNINGEEVQNPSRDKSFVILRPTGAGGQAVVNVTVENLSQVFQRAEQTFQIFFTGDEPNPFF
jgi:hypothetical protein